MNNRMKGILLAAGVICITLAVLYGRASEFMHRFPKINVKKYTAEERRYTRRLEEAVSEPRIVEETVLVRKKVYELDEKDYNNLCRIVEAEATGEDLEGRILVANVIMNRVRSKKFPDSVSQVIMQRDHGSVQFSPVSDGRFWRVSVSELTRKAVEQVIYGTDHSGGAMYFVSKKGADPEKYSWFRQKLQYLFAHGGHEFYR